MLRKIILFGISSLILLSGWPLAANVSTSPYGINVHLPGNDVLQKVKDAGIKWIRIDINWFAVEQTVGNFNYTEIDRVVAFADANDLSILAVLAYTPGWANNNKGINYPPDNEFYWKYFVQETVRRYKNSIKYWCIWNEPNLDDFFAEGKDAFVEKIFIPAGDGIRGTDPTAFIVGPGLSHLTSQGREWYFWMTYILTLAGEYIDVVSHHIYKSEGVSRIYDVLEQGDNLIPAVKDVVKDTGHEFKPFWITETGWHTNQVSETEQGDRYLSMLQKRKEKDYPKKIFFYEIKDDPAPGIEPWGILRSDLTAKPAYSVYKDFIAGKYDGSGNGGDEEEENKQCFARYDPDGDGRKKAHMLSTLRGFRDYLKRVFPAGDKLVDIYYGKSGEFLELSLSDSRVHRLGQELLYTMARAVGNNPGNYLNRPPDVESTQKINRLITLLKEKKMSPSFERVLFWAEKQLKMVEKIPLNRYLSRELKREIETLTGKKDR